MVLNAEVFPVRPWKFLDLRRENFGSKLLQKYASSMRSGKLFSTRGLLHTRQLDLRVSL